MRNVVRILLVLGATCLPNAAGADAPRRIRSLSGPSGKVVGSKFVFDETRNRFVYPQDKTLTVYFEWEAPQGLHVLTGSWRRPDGRVASISSDVKIETQSTVFELLLGIHDDAQSPQWRLVA